MPTSNYQSEDYLIQVVDAYSYSNWQTGQSQIRSDLNLHCLQKQGISRFSRTRVNCCSVMYHVTLIQKTIHYIPLDNKTYIIIEIIIIKKMSTLFTVSTQLFTSKWLLLTVQNNTSGPALCTGFDQNVFNLGYWKRYLSNTACSFSGINTLKL